MKMVKWLRLGRALSYGNGAKAEHCNMMQSLGPLDPVGPPNTCQHGKCMLYDNDYIDISRDGCKRVPLPYKQCCLFALFWVNMSGLKEIFPCLGT